MIREKRRPQIASKGLITFESMAQCVSVTGIPLEELKKAKQSGCDAFSGSKVYLMRFLAWYFTEGYTKLTTSDIDINAEKARILKLKGDFMEIENRKDDDEWIKLGEVEELITSLLAMPMRAALLQLPTTLDTRCNPDNPAIARSSLQQWVDETMRMLTSKLK